MLRVLVLVGRIASGKTSTAHFIAERLPNVHVVTVSSVLRQLAARRGVDGSSRAALQHFGLELVEREPAVLAQAIAARAPDEGTLVLDGLRSAVILTLLRDVFEGSFLSAYLDVPAVVRKARYEAQLGVDVAEFEHIDAHPIEAEVEGMRTLTDVEVDASLPVEDVGDQIIKAFLEHSR